MGHYGQAELEAMRNELNFAESEIVVRRLANVLRVELPYSANGLKDKLYILYKVDGSRWPQRKRRNSALGGSLRRSANRSH